MGADPTTGPLMCKEAMLVPIGKGGAVASRAKNKTQRGSPWQWRSRFRERPFKEIQANEEIKVRGSRAVTNRGPAT